MIRAILASLVCATGAFAQPASVQFRIVERESQPIASAGTNADADPVLNMAVQARVVGGAGKALGNFSFSVRLLGEPEGNGTFARLLISNVNGTYDANTAQTISSIVGRGGLAAPYTYFAGINSSFNGVFDASSGPFVNGPDAEIGLVTGAPIGSSLLAVAGTAGRTDGLGNPVPDTWVSGNTAPLDAGVAQTYLGGGGQWVDVYRFRYSVSNLLPRELRFTLQNVQAQVFTSLVYGTAWGPATPVQASTSVADLVVPVCDVQRPIAGVGGTVCGNQSFALTATALQGDEVRWFEGSCNGPLVGVGNTVTVSPAVTTTYFARAYATGGCFSSDCESVTVVVAGTPQTPVAGSGSTICLGELATVSATAGPNEQIDWYLGSCDGTYLTTGSSFNLSPFATTTLYARARNIESGCVSASCAAVTINVSTPPAAPQLGPAQSVCSGVPLSLSANVPTGVTVDWFTGSCGGTPIGTGTSLQVQPVATTTYFARSRTIATGCVGGCASVTIGVNTPPNTPNVSGGGTICEGQSATISAGVSAGETIDWFTGSCGDTPAGTGPSLQVSPSTTTTYYARARRTASGCLSQACGSVTVTVNPRPAPPLVGTGGAICAGDSFTLSATAGANEQIEWFTGSCGGTIVGSGPSLIVSPSETTTYFARSTNIATSCGGTSCSSVTVVVNARPSAPNVGSGGGICSGQSFTLTASVGSGLAVDWFVSTCSGTPIGSGASLVVSPTTTTIYFARARNISSGCTGPCSQVTVNVTSTPTSPTTASSTSTSYCSAAAPATITLTATGGTGGTIRWYSGSCGATPVGVGSPLTIAAPSTTTTYFARRENGTCVSSGCPSVTVTVSQSPVPPVNVGLDNPIFCSGTISTITLTAAGGSGETLRWFSGSCGGTPIGTGSPLSIPAPTSSQTYFARWETPSCGVTSCVSVSVTVNPAPVALTAITTSDNDFCAGSVPNITLSAEGGSGITLEWFVGGCGGSSIGTGTMITIPSPTVTTTYSARYSSPPCGVSACVSTTVNVDVVTGACCTGTGVQRICTVVLPANCASPTSPAQAYRGDCSRCATSLCCAADHDNLGSVTVGDIFAFLNDWFAGSPFADFNAGGSVTVQDIFDFLNTWFAGC